MSRQLLHHLERGCWGVTVVCVVVTGAAALHSSPLLPQRTHPVPPMTDDVAMYDREILAQAADSVIANDGFRLERRPSRVAFGTTLHSMPSTSAPPPVSLRPHVTVGGIIGGPPWRAVLNGVPNHDGGTVVAPGDTLGGLLVRSIRRDTVVVRGQDTTWTLTVEH